MGEVTPVEEERQPKDKSEILISKTDQNGNIRLSSDGQKILKNEE